MSAIFKSRFCAKIVPSLGLANLHFVLRFWADTSGAKMRFIASQMPKTDVCDCWFVPQICLTFMLFYVILSPLRRVLIFDIVFFSVIVLVSGK